MKIVLIIILLFLSVFSSKSQSLNTIKNLMNNRDSIVITSVLISFFKNYFTKDSVPQYLLKYIEKVKNEKIFFMEKDHSYRFKTRKSKIYRKFEFIAFSDSLILLNYNKEGRVGTQNTVIFKIKNKNVLAHYFINVPFVYSSEEIKKFLRNKEYQFLDNFSF